MMVLSLLSVPGEGVSGGAIVPIVPALGGWLTDELDWPEPVPGVDLDRLLEVDSPSPTLALLVDVLDG